jgi:hypothetical protein
MRKDQIPFELTPQDDEGRQVHNRAPADYSAGGELLKSLLLAVESICEEIELRRLGRGE